MAELLSMKNLNFYRHSSFRLEFQPETPPAASPELRDGQKPPMTDALTAG
jgi:hypothetical protein